MLNKIFIMGRLTRDPELRRTANSTPVTSFSLAVDRDFKSQSGEKSTDFIDVGVCRSGTGRTRTATTAAARRWWPTMCISAIPSATVPPAATILPPRADTPHP